MISLVGSSPSAGSTLLADLLDSTPFSACGVELEFFSNKALYDFESYKKDLSKTGAYYHISTTGLFNEDARFHKYGLSLNDIGEMIKKSASVSEFLDHFTMSYLNYRSKDPKGIVFEKSPINLNTIKEFLDAYPTGHFIYIVRNPLYQYASCLTRKFGNYIALATWLVDAAKYYQYKDHERVIVVRYEDLVKEPFKIVRDIFIKTSGGHSISEEDLAEAYKNNDHRKNETTRLKSWGIQEVGVIKNANDKELKPDIFKQMSSLLNAKVSKKYSELFDVAELSFLDALQEFGYFDEVFPKLSAADGKNIPGKTVKDFEKLSAKWARAYMNKTTKPSELSTFLNPLERIIGK